MIQGLYKKILWLGLSAALIFSPIGKGGMRIWSIMPILLILYAIIFVWLWRVNNKDCFVGASRLLAMTKMKSTAIDIPIFLFMALASVSFIFSAYKHDSFYAILKLFSYAGVYYIVVNEFSHIMRRRLLWLVVCTGAAVSLYGFLQYLGIFTHSWWNPKDFLASTYVNHNHFAGYLELIIPVAIGLLFKGKGMRNGWQPLFLIACLVIMVTDFMLCQSRGAWMSLSAAFIVMVILMPKKDGGDKKKIIASALVLIMICAIFYFGRGIVAERLGSISQESESQETSFGVRLMIWQGTVRMIAANPVTGTGIGTLVWAFPPYRPEGLNFKIDFAHNDYLHMAAEMGVLAPLVMIWLIVIVVSTAIKKSRFDAVKFYCGIGVLSISLHGLVDFNFNIPANVLLFTVWTAIIMTEGNRDA